MSTLITDLQRCGRLDRTLIVVATEFGRPPEFDNAGGRGHQSEAFSIVLAGKPPRKNACPFGFRWSQRGGIRYKPVRSPARGCETGN
jgi:hypothetical protein